MIWYVLAEGTPSTTAPVAGQIKAIAVMTSDWHFTSPDTAQGAHNLKTYLPDAQGSMLPAKGAVPFLDVSYEGVLAFAVPLDRDLQDLDAGSEAARNKLNQQEKRPNLCKALLSGCVESPAC